MEVGHTRAHKQTPAAHNFRSKFSLVSGPTVAKQPPRPTVVAAAFALTRALSPAFPAKVQPVSIENEVRSPTWPSESPTKYPSYPVSISVTFRTKANRDPERRCTYVYYKDPAAESSPEKYSSHPSPEQQKGARYRYQAWSTLNPCPHPP